MSNVVCTNTACVEVDIPKTNPFGYPVEDIRCGACGQPVSAAPEEDTMSSPEPEPTPEPAPEEPAPEPAPEPPAEEPVT